MTTAGSNLAPSDNLQPTNLPIFPGYAFVQAVDIAIRETLAQQWDLSGLANWFDPQVLPEAALSAIIEFYGIGGLDTTVFTDSYQRNILAAANTLLEYRGTEYVLEQYALITGLEYDHTYVRDAAGRATGIRFTITPPLQRTPGTNWESYLRRAFRWLTAPDLELLTFDITVDFEGEIFATSWFQAELVAY